MLLFVEQSPETDEVRTTEVGSVELINDRSDERSLVKLRKLLVNYTVTSLLPVKTQTRIDFHDSKELFDFLAPGHSQRKAEYDLFKLDTKNANLTSELVCSREFKLKHRQSGETGRKE